MLLNNRYLLQEPIGRGGLATIYRVWDTHMQRVVALKLLREVYCTKPSVVRRFQYDAELRYSLKHPNIVQVYDYGYSNGNYYMVMELIEGIDLRRYLRSRGILNNDHAIIITHHVALGLGAAHSLGIVHRNVNPQNILMGQDGSIKLTSFCMANVVGEVQYYGIGIIMYEMLTGHPPFDGDSPVAVAL